MEFFSLFRRFLKKDFQQFDFIGNDGECKAVSEKNRRKFLKK